MSDMPERILAWREEDEYIDHVLINKCWGETSEVPSWDATEYIRADLAAPDPAELVEALRIAGPIALADFANHPFVLNEDEKRKVAVISAALAKLGVR